MTRYDLSAELSVIGSLLVWPECVAQVVSVTEPSDYQTERGRAIFETVRDLHNSGQTITPQTVADKLAFDVGIVDYITAAMTASVPPDNISANIRVMRDTAKRDRLKDIAFEITQYDGGALDAADMAARLRDALAAFDKSVSSAVSGSEALAAWARYYDTVSTNPGAAYCKTGYQSLDRALGGGLFNGEVYIIAGRPGMGKTTQGINIAERCAKDGRTVLFASLEMSAIQITAKRLATVSGAPYTDILSGGAKQDDLREIYAWASNISNRPFYIADTVRTISDIAREAGSIKDLSLIVIDYIGLIQTGDRPAPRYEEMTRISADLKALAKRLNKPILALAQLNRENVGRSEKRPMLSDLRDSGAIEQDAGGVILLHRESYYKTDEEPPEYEPIELIIAKSRHAVTGTVKMMWHGKTGAITDTAWVEE